MRMFKFKRHPDRKKITEDFASVQLKLNDLETLNSTLEAELSNQRIKISQLKESEERFRMLAESSPNAILLTDDHNQIKMINHQAEMLLGYDRSELVGSSIDVLIPSRFRNKHKKHSKMYFNDPQARIMGHGRDLSALHKSGNEIPVEIGLTPLFSQGQLIVLITIVDITERKKHEERLRQQNEELLRSSYELEKRTSQLIQSEKMSALGTLVAGVAHELNNPLTGILHYSQYLKKNRVDDQKYNEIIDDIILEAKRCEEIVKNLLQYAYPHEDSRKNRINEDALREILEGTCQLFILKNNEIKFLVSIDHHFQDFYFNINKLKQITANLIKNAVDAVETCPKKEIMIRVSSNKHQCNMVIEDTGIGIDQENLHRIFDPFYTTKEVGKGTGLGLSITRKIIEDDGGSINLSSQVGKGTTIHLIFPLIQEEKTIKIYEQTTGNRR